ncbi:MAG TPA: PAS domain-containing protein, partial [Gemmatimonadales bacterium]|nr:PAS domain-containing protein [Gemmatimonadales bacterium]
MVPALSAPYDRIPLGIALAAGAVVLMLLGLWLAERRRRRQAQRAESTALGQLRTITATMREGVIAYDMDLRLTTVNPAFERLTGYPLEDLQDQEFLQY